MAKITSNLKIKQEVFDKNQKSLMARDIDKEDAAKLATSNRVIKRVSACKKSNNGNFAAVEELNDLIEKWKGSEKPLHTVLDLEILFRKFAFFNVKATCPLFKQLGFSVHQKLKNLTTLISSQLKPKVLAEMEDLEKGINIASDDQITNEDEGIEVVQD